MVIPTFHSSPTPLWLCHELLLVVDLQSTVSGYLGNYDYFGGSFPAGFTSMVQYYNRLFMP